MRRRFRRTEVIGCAPGSVPVRFRRISEIIHMDDQTRISSTSRTRGNHGNLRACRWQAATHEEREETGRSGGVCPVCRT